MHRFACVTTTRRYHVQEKSYVAESELKKQSDQPASSLHATVYETSRNPSTSSKFNRSENTYASKIQRLLSPASETVRGGQDRGREKGRLWNTEKELLSGNWRARRMTVLICTRSLELKVPSGALINLGVREERRFLNGDSTARDQEGAWMRKKGLCYRRTRSPQDVIAEQTEGPRTISINKIYAARTQSACYSFLGY